MKECTFCLSFPLRLSFLAILSDLGKARKICFRLVSLALLVQLDDNRGLSEERTMGRRDDRPSNTDLWLLVSLSVLCRAII
jgi:hypothetical protein